MGFFDFLGKAAGAVGGFAIGGPAGAAAGYGLADSISRGASKGKQADRLGAEAQRIAHERYQAGAPMRSKLATLALNLPRDREDTSALFADPGNPYARVIPRPAPTPPTVTGGMGRVFDPAPAREHPFKRVRNAARPMDSPLAPLPARQSTLARRAFLGGGLRR